MLWSPVFSLLLLAAPAMIYEHPECAWAKGDLYRCCDQHALAYMKGGTERDRELADAVLKYCLKLEGADDRLIDAVYTSARIFGGVRCRGYRCWRYPPTPAHASRVYNEGLGWGLSYQRR